MGINATDLKHRVIIPTLQHLELYSVSALQLLMGTAAAESRLGHYLVQQGGRALGIYQVEPATHLDLFKNFLEFRPALREKVRQLLAPIFTEEEQLITNLAYATAMARLVYYRIPEPLPEPYDLEGCARYWKKYYNTHLGKGTEAHFIKNYRELCE